MTTNTWITGTNGGLLRVQTDGSYEWDPNGDFDDLALGDTATTVYYITAEDNVGASEVATLTVTASNTLITVNVLSGNEAVIHTEIPATMDDEVVVTVIAEAGSVGEGTYTFTAAQITGSDVTPVYFPATGTTFVVQE